MSEQGDQLREAAKLLRQRAEAVQHFTSPWRSVPCDDGSDQWAVGYNTDHPDAGLIATTPDYGQDYLPDFIATMHPAFALAVADLVEEIARQFDAPPCDDPTGVCNGCERREDFNDAHRAALAILAVQGCTTW
jgi:hypothetical protein